MAQEEETKEPKEPEATGEQETETKPTEEARSLSQEDINKLIEAARKQEKDKLYDTIGSLKSQVEELSKNSKEAQEAREKAEREAQEKLESERLSQLSAEEQMQEQLKKLEQRLEKEAQQREALDKKLQQERTERELLEYRQQLLDEAGDKLIKELVQGSTKEELQNSVASAKAKYQQYFDATVNAAEGNSGREVQVPQMPKPTNADEEALGDHLRGLNLQVDPDDISHTRVSEDYKKNREKILAQVAAAYRKSQ